MLHQIVYINFLVGLCIGVAVAQNGGTTAGGQTYTCVLPGTCPTDNGQNPGTIDPRIVTPGQLCPAGTVPCYGTINQCGVRSVQNPSTADGQATPGAFPWQAYLQNSTHTFAGSGVLIDQYHVLTAAHKVANSVNSPTTVRVLMGVYNPTLLTNVVTSTVARIILHPQFNPTTLRNDIAVLRLSTPVSIGTNTNINTACLPTAGASYVGQRCVVSGWGQTAFTTFDAPTNPMKQVYVNIVDYNTCRTSYSAANLLGGNVDTYLDTNEICAGGDAMKDACSQDGGSPLVCPDASGNYNVVGLVIWGKGCGQTGVYGVYVSIPAYRNWIDTTLASLNAG